MPRQLYIAVLFLSLNQIQSFGQIRDGLLIDSTLFLKVGIYTSIDDFLNNSPSFPYNFKVISEKPDYIISRKEQDNYFLDFYTQYGEPRIIPLEEVWGFFDGYGIYLNNKGRPYQLIYLGQISILKFVKIYHKNQTSKFVSILLTGNTVVGAIETDFSFYLMQEDIIVPYKEKELSNILKKDPDLHEIYTQEKKKEKWAKRYKYISKYNEIHSLSIEESGILIK